MKKVVKRVLGGIFFLSLVFILACSGWTFEKIPARLSILIGALYAKKEGKIAYRGGLFHLRDGGIVGLDICLLPDQERKRYSAKLSLEAKVPEPEVEGKLSIYLNWWWRQIEEKKKRSNTVYSLFIGEKRKFSSHTYLYGELGIAYPSREALFLWGWGFKAGWEIAPWIEINSQYGQFLTEEEKILGYDQWTLKGELKFTLGRSLFLLGYEKSSVDDPFYLLNMHLLQAWYACLQISF